MKLPKSTRSTKKYTSPYLEPLPQPHHPWIKVKEVNFHNKNVRQQRMRNKMKAIQLQQQHNKEVNDNHHNHNSYEKIKNIEGQLIFIILFMLKFTHTISSTI